MRVPGCDRVLIQDVEAVGSLGVPGGEDGGFIDKLIVKVLGVEGAPVVSAQEAPANEEHDCYYVEQDEER